MYIYFPIFHCAIFFMALVTRFLTHRNTINWFGNAPRRSTDFCIDEI
jgi:hypothetical protein